MAQLTKRFCDAVREAGRYGDGARREGLALVVKPGGAKSWAQRLVIQGRRRELGLGSFKHVTLAEAREAAYANSKLARTGGDPLADRRRRRATPSLAEATEAVISMHSPTWRAKGAVTAFRNSVNRYCRPMLGMPVDVITSADVLGALTPIWVSKPKAAEHLRGQLALIMGWAIGQGHRHDDPMPAARAALPKRARAVVHHRTVGHAELAAALARIRSAEAWPCQKLAVEFIALTACRSGEVRGATWGEVNLETATWTIPSARMKMARDHRVPLSDRALDVLRAARQYGDGAGLVFPSSRGGQMAANALTRLISACGLADKMTIHGLRSAFRDFCAEDNQERELAEAALAHKVSGIEGAYLRSDVLDRRRALMEAWSNYLARG